MTDAPRSAPRLSFRVPISTLERLDALATELGITRTALVRRMVDAGLSGVPLAPAKLPTEDELLGVLAERARAGNTSATRSLLIRLEARDKRAVALDTFAAMVEAEKQR
jgi:hypothetical protein